MNYLIIGNIASGKSSLAEEISKKTGCEIFAIDDMRKTYSDGSFAGEFKAWAEMLEVIQHPQPDGKGVYEFSGTGKNAWFVAKAIEYSMELHKSDWRTIYCLCDEKELIKRCEGRQYDIPIPYEFKDPAESREYMSRELRKKFGGDFWYCPEITVRTDQSTPGEIADLVLGCERRGL